MAIQVRAPHNASLHTHQMMTLLVLQQYHLYIDEAAGGHRKDTITDGHIPSKHASAMLFTVSHLELLSALVHQHIHSLQEAAEVVSVGATLLREMEPCTDNMQSSQQRVLTVLTPGFLRFALSLKSLATLRRSSCTVVISSSL